MSSCWQSFSVLIRIKCDFGTEDFFKWKFGQMLLPFLFESSLFSALVSHTLHSYWPLKRNPCYQQIYCYSLSFSFSLSLSISAFFLIFCLSLNMSFCHQQQWEMAMSGKEEACSLSCHTIKRRNARKHENDKRWDWTVEWLSKASQLGGRFFGMKILIFW